MKKFIFLLPLLSFAIISPFLNITITGSLFLLFLALLATAALHEGIDP